ncbi:MAG: hypothetical protein EBU70_08480 [Actinobacteria bacterium]|nr:hypothetical protein [Actinomycetota bacterium]
MQDGDAARRLAAVKVRAVAPHLPIGARTGDLEFSHGAAVAGSDGVAAWIDGSVAADAAVLWWARRSPDLPLHLVGEPSLGCVARRLTGLDVAVWEASDGGVRRAEPGAPAPRVPVPAAHEPFAATIERCGAEPVREYGARSTARPTGWCTRGAIQRSRSARSSHPCARCAAAATGGTRSRGSPRPGCCGAACSPSHRSSAHRRCRRRSRRTRAAD